MYESESDGVEYEKTLPYSQLVRLSFFVVVIDHTQRAFRFCSSLAVHSHMHTSLHKQNKRDKNECEVGGRRRVYEHFFFPSFC